MLPQQIAKNSTWSDALCDAILRSNCDDGDRSDIVRRARRNKQTRRELMQRWRVLHPEVISAADCASLDGPSRQCEALLRQFGAEEVLLELITDEHENGWELAHAVVRQIERTEIRSQLAEILDRWTRPPSPNLRTQDYENLQVVVFGGRVRDESKHLDLFDNTSFIVRWMVCERHHGSADYRIVTNALQHTDAAIVVVGMVSHTIMWQVKRYSKLNQLPWKPIPKATGRHLKNALAELFPDRIANQEKSLPPMTTQL